MSRQLAAAFALLLCIGCDHGLPVQPPPPSSGGSNHPPTATIRGQSTGREGASLYFSAEESTDPDHDTLTYTWLTGDGRTFTTTTTTIVNDVVTSVTPLATTGWTYPDNGTYIASVIVTDHSGAADTASMTVTIVNVAPVVRSFSVPTQQAAGIPAIVWVLFSDSGSADSHVATFNWGDGTSSSRVMTDTSFWVPDSAVHVYAATGSYSITATIRDDDGGAVTVDSPSPVHVFDATEHNVVAGYDVRDLGTLGGNSARPADINDRGEVVGSSLTASGEQHAFIWDDGPLHDLGTLGRSSSEAQRINDAGLIAGQVGPGEHFWNERTSSAIWNGGTGRILESTEPTYEEPGPRATAGVNESGDIVLNRYGHESIYAWLWRNEAWHRLGGLLSASSPSHVAAMNERGQIVGTTGAVYGGDYPSPVQHAFLWEDGAMRDLGVLGFKPCRNYPDRNCSYSSASDVNQNGQVVGTSSDSLGNDHFVLWRNGTIVDLGPAATAYPGPGARLFINDHGQIVGSAGGEGFFWSDGNRQPLGSLGGLIEVAGLNENGEVIGTRLTGTGEQHVFVWSQSRGMVDLGTGPHGFSGGWVVGINSRGDILGYTAPCVLDYYDRCAYPSQVRAILWRKP
jgi:probable HAF family extracellular repeat protein